MITLRRGVSRARSVAASAAPAAVGGVLTLGIGSAVCAGEPQSAAQVVAESPSPQFDSIDSLVSISPAGRIGFAATAPGNLSAGYLQFGAGEPVRFTPTPVTNRQFFAASVNDAAGGSLYALERYTNPPVVSWIKGWTQAGVETTVGDSFLGDYAASGNSPHVDVNPEGVAAFVAIPLGQSVLGLWAGSARPPTLIASFAAGTLLRPEIGGGNRIVVRNASGGIVMYPFPNTGSTTIASSVVGSFTGNGARPGISDDGRTIGFIGTQGGVQGVYLAVSNGATFSAPFLLAPIATAGADGIQSLVVDGRVSVQSRVFSSGSLGITACFEATQFKRTTEGGSETFGAVLTVKCVATALGGLQRVEDPVVALRLGESRADIGNRSVTSINLFHPLSANGQVALWANLSGGSAAVLRITPPDSLLFDGGVCGGSGSATAAWSDETSWVPERIPDDGTAVRFGAECSPGGSGAELAATFDGENAAAKAIVVGPGAAVELQGSGTVRSDSMDLAGGLAARDTVAVRTKELLLLPEASDWTLAIDSGAALAVSDPETGIQSGKLLIGVGGSLKMDLREAAIRGDASLPTVQAPIVIDGGRVELSDSDDNPNGFGALRLAGGITMSADSVVRVEIGGDAAGIVCDELQIGIGGTTAIDGTLEVRVPSAILSDSGPPTGTAARFLSFPSTGGPPDLGRFRSVRILDWATSEPISPSSARTIGVMYSKDGLDLVVLNTPRAVISGSNVFEALPVMNWMASDKVVLATHGTNSTVEAWPISMLDAMMAKTSDPGWGFAVFDWHGASLAGSLSDFVTGAGNTARRAFELGQSMAFWTDQCRGGVPLSSIHVLAHSSGAWFTDGFATAYGNLHPTTFIENTMFDANDILDGEIYQPRASMALGDAADFALQIVDRRLLTCGVEVGLDMTQHILPNALNVDVTPADTFLPVSHCSLPCDVACLHGWPYAWYRESIDKLPIQVSRLPVTNPSHWGFQLARAREGVLPVQGAGSSPPARGTLVWVTPDLATFVDPIELGLGPDNVVCGLGCCTFSSGGVVISTTCQFRTERRDSSNTSATIEFTADAPLLALTAQLNFAPPGGIVALVVDGGSPTIVDRMTAADQQESAYLVFNPPLSPGLHHLDIMLEAAYGPGAQVTVGNIALNMSAPPFCSGDADHNGLVNFADITAVLASYGSSGSQPQSGDADGDGDADLADVTAVLASFLSVCP